MLFRSDEFRDFLIKDVRGDVAFFGLRSMERFEGARSLGLGGWELRYAGLPMRLALPGAHNLSNALASIRVAELFGVDPGDIAAGLEAQAPLSGRGEILCGPVCIVNDCYNANAESTLAALSFCDEAELPGRRIYVLGSMKELGTESEAAHRRVGAAAAESRADALFFLGEEARWAYLEASARRPDSSETRHYERFEDLSSALKSFVREGDTVLLKASRSMALERLIDVLNVRGGTNAS